MRVLIADDQDFIRRALRKLLAEEPDIQVCGEAHDGDTAVRMVQMLLPDVGDHGHQHACSRWATGNSSHSRILPEGSGRNR